MLLLSRRSFALAAGGGLAAQLRRVPVTAERAEQPLAAAAVTGFGGFAGRRFRLNIDNNLKTFDIAHYVAMVEEKKHRDWWWIGEQPGKWLESAIYASASSGDAELHAKAQGVMRRLIAAQDVDGYMGITDPSLRTARRPIRGMDPYELYFTLHALVTAHEQWGSEPALASGVRLGDFFLSKIGPGKAEFWPLPRPVTIAGHEVHYSLEGTLLIDPMMRLYEASRDRRYLAWCEWAVSNIDRWSVSDTFSNLDKVAAGRMNLGEIQPNVHSHTLHMNMIGFLRLYQATGDRHYLTKVQGAWRNIVENYRYVTGGVSVGEGYREPHALPNTGNVVETCASMSWMLLNQYLLELTADPMYADTIERLLWSHLFAAQTSDGDGFRYFCPLNGWKPAGYFTGPDCCSASGARIIAMLPSLVYASSRDAVYVNQYVDSSAQVKLEGSAVTLRQRTKYPEDGNIVLEVQTQEPAAFAVNLRLPEWCLSPSAKVNGEPLNDLRRGGYATVRRTWKTGDRIELSLPMEVRRVEGDHTNSGLFALERGPMVYALDAIWQNEPTARALAGDRKSDHLPGLRGIGPELREAAVPEGALGPAYEVNAVLTSGQSTKALLLPFANLGKWYRTAEEKAAGLRETQGSSNPRGQPIKSQRTPYAVWLRPASAS